MPSKTVLLFRSKTEEASNDDAYEKLLHDHGCHVRTISPIQFQFINDDLLRQKLQSGDYGALIFTSKRAVEAVQRVLPDAERHRWARIYVEGPATGILVRDLFGSSTAVLGAESGGSESLADFIIGDTRQVNSTVRLLFPCARARLDALPNKLSKEPKIQLDELIVYETIASTTLDQELDNHLKQHGIPDVLGFFSPSGFDSVFKASQRIGFDLTANKTVLISLGKTTSAAIRQSLQSSSINERSCLKPTPEEFLRALQSLD